MSKWMSSNTTPVTIPLSARNRKIFLMLRLQGQLDSAEIAKNVGVPETTVEKELAYLQSKGYVKCVGGYWRNPDYNSMKKGDKIQWRAEEGTLLEDSHYEVDKLAGVAGSGLHYATVQWSDGEIQKDFMLNRRDLQWRPIGLTVAKDRGLTKKREEPKAVKRGSMDKWMELV